MRLGRNLPQQSAQTSVTSNLRRPNSGDALKQKPPDNLDLALAVRRPPARKAIGSPALIRSINCLHSLLPKLVVAMTAPCPNKRPGQSSQLWQEAAILRSASNQSSCLTS